MRPYLRLFVIIVSFCQGTLASGARDIGAWSSMFPLPELSAVLVFSEPTEKIERALERERSGQSALKTWVFSVGIDVDISPLDAGQWDTIPGIGYVWRIGVHAEHAHSLNLILEKYKMPPGMSLYVYDRSALSVAGPFDDRHNANGGLLPVQSLPGDMLTVEWNVPVNRTPDNHFAITSVGYGFRGVADSEAVRFSTADICNVDVNCKTGNHWQREKRAVVRLETTLQTSAGRETMHCTGALVNQAVDADQKKPYILTAYHCVSTPEAAQSTTFLFGYEKEFCDGVRPVLRAGIAGSTLVATKKELDFALLELLPGRLSPSHNAFYAGWNASSSTPQGVTGIHHPQGDVKKISVANDALGTGTFNDPSSGLQCFRNAHWIVGEWDEGVTERGSSGSPIFDAQRKIVGTLSGGAATCRTPINDYYSKFSEQWSREFPNESECLKPWLDPLNTGVVSIGGYDPVTRFEGEYEMRGNIGKNELKKLIESGERGYLSSQNDRNWISFAEKIQNDSIASVIGMEVHVAKVSEPNASVRFSVWSGSEFPVTLLHAKSMTVSDDYSGFPMRIYFDRKLEIHGDFFIGYSVDGSNPEELFAVYQSAERPHSGLSSMYVEDDSGNWWNLDEIYLPQIFSSLGIRALGSFPKERQLFLNTYKELKILSQQGGNIFACFEDPATTVYFECFDTSGRQMMIREIGRHMVKLGESAYLQVELDVDSLPPGIYFIRAFDKNKTLSGKFVKH